VVVAAPPARSADPGRLCVYGDHSLFDDYTGVVLDLEEGKRLAHALGGNKAVILSNHGLLTVGQTSVDEAAWWFITMERTCQAQLLAEAAGTPCASIPTGRRRRRSGRAVHGGWRAFQPLYDWIVSVQPDLLDE